MGSARRLAGWVGAAALLMACTTGCGTDAEDAADPGPTPSQTQEAPATSTLIALGLDQIDAGDRNAAGDSFRSVLDLDPTNVYAHYNLGYLAQLDGDTATAVEQYTAALDTDGAFAPALYNLAILTEPADLDAAITLYRREIAAAPDDAGGHYRLGKALMETGHRAEGKGMLARAYDLDPSLRD